MSLTLPEPYRPLETPAAIAGLSLPDLLDRAAARHPAKAAIIVGERVVDYAAYRDQAYALANHLLDLGLPPGGRVGLFMDKGPEVLIAFLGAAAAGGVVFPLDYNQPPEVLQYVLGFTQPLALVTDERHQALLDSLTLPLPRENVVVSLGPGGRPARPEYAVWDRVMARSSFARPAVALNPGEPVYLNFTSGTTGRPKGAVTTHLNLLYNTLAAVQALELTPEDVHLCMFPVVAHPHELLARPLFLGGAAVLVEGIRPGALAQTIAQRRVTAMMAVASIYETLARAGEAITFDLTSLRVAESGGMHVPPELVRRFRECYGTAMVPVWGSTETTGIALAAPLGSGAPAGSMGRPAPYYQVKVLGEDGAEAGPGVVGEMAVSGPAVCASYYNNPGESQRTLPGGWFVSGDLVKTDEKGYFYFVDRKARLMKVGGLKVFCAEIEQALAAHPQVMEAAVVRVRDGLHGEVPKAFVAPAAGAELDAKTLRRFLEGRLARYKLPKAFEFRPSLPKNPAGKILWRALQDEAGE